MSRWPALLLIGCASALPPPSRALCYANADQHAQDRVNAECSGDAGVHFATCPSHAAIMAELRASQEACQ